MIIWGARTNRRLFANRMRSMTEIRIELHSDTQTRPTPGMRKAMAEAVVGDEQKGEDPSVNKLLDMARALFGKEDAVFLPSLLKNGLQY